MIEGDVTTQPGVDLDLDVRPGGATMRLETADDTGQADWPNVRALLRHTGLKAQFVATICSGLCMESKGESVSARQKHAGPDLWQRIVDALELIKQTPRVKIALMLFGAIVTIVSLISGLMTMFPLQSAAKQPEGSAPSSAETTRPAAPSPVSAAPSETPSASALPTLDSLTTSGAHFGPILNPSDFKLPDADICVVMWCQATTFNLDGTLQTDQTQIKLKARVVNDSTKPMDISISNPSAMRLLVSGSGLPGNWSPPPKTVASGDKPILVSWAGSGSAQNYWALPPNAFADSYATKVGVYTGFYTQWDPPILQPGQSYYRPRPEVLDPAYEDGNLVFQVPNGTKVYGLAVVNRLDPTEILGVTPFSDWKDHQVEPGSF